MDQQIDAKDMKVLLKSQQGELDAVLMYQALAKVAKDQKNDKKRHGDTVMALL